MKTNSLITAMVLMAAASVIFFIDYILTVLVGIAAEAFDAGSAFYNNIYPIIVGSIITVSIAYPLAYVLMKKESKNQERTISVSTKNQAVGYKQSA